MTLSERDRRALIFGAATLGVIGAYFGVFEPLLGRYERLVKWHGELAARIKRDVMDSRKLALQQEQVKTWEEKAGALVVERSYSEQITAVGSRIVAAAGENQVQLQGATPTAPTPWVDTWAVAGKEEERLEQAVINIDAQGGWENAFKFIAAVYRIDGILSVEQLELSGDPKQGGQLKMRLAISVLMKASGEGRRS